MATAKKLPSGSWRCLVYDYTDDSGKRHYQSFTSEDSSPKGKRQAEFMAAEYSINKKRPDVNRITVGEAMETYIAGRSSVLSPRTIKEYKRSRRCDLQDLMDICIFDLRQEDIQFSINKEATCHSPKSVRNMHGLLSAVIKLYRPEFALNTSLPQKIRPNLYIPTDSDIKVLLTCVNNEEMLIAILLAAFGPMRRSEICALESSDIVNGVAHVQRAIVLDEFNNWVVKTTKSYSGDRYIPIPDLVMDKIRDCKGKLVSLTPSQVSDRFIGIQKASGLPHFRFHDLRHYCASIQHAMGIPDAYIMQRGGWGSDAVLKQVYRHALSDKETEMNLVANNYFNDIMQHKMQHK